jgi:ankyrin repeat protein
VLTRALIGEFIDASVRDQAAAARLLAAHPDLIDARWLHGGTVLHFLAIEGFADGVRFLAERGADVNAVNDFGDPPLIDVVVLGHIDIAAVLLRHGANPNARSTTHDSVLHCAVERGNDRLVAMLLAAGADARYRTDLGQSVFDAIPASGAQRDSILAVLAKHGVMPDAGYE